MTAHLNAYRKASTFSCFISQCLQAHADVRLRSAPDHLLRPATDAADAAIDRVIAAHRDRVSEMERAVMAFVDELDAEVRQ